MRLREERAQATVEMAVVTPVLLVLALIVYNVMTFASAVARFDRVPAGTYPVRAWLPARGGHPAVVATGSITVAADSDAALTLVLAP